MATDKNIHTAILAIMKEVGYVQKERKAAVRYSLKTEEAILKAIRPVMIAHDVIMLPVEIADIAPSSYVNHKDTYFNEVKFSRGFKFVHVPSGTAETVWVYGVGNDTGDKAGNKAMTTAKKYALLDTFLIVTGDDPDYEPSPDENSTKKENLWTKPQRDAVMNSAPSVNPNQLNAFLDMTGLSDLSKPHVTGKFAKAYQGKLDEIEQDGGDPKRSKGKALEYAKANWQNGEDNGK